MLNNIYIQDKLIIDRVVHGKLGYFLLDDGSKIHGVSQNYSRDDITIECCICKNKSKIKTVTTTPLGHLKKKYECFSCRSKGVKNSFYGKKHTSEFKKSLSEQRMGKAIRKDGLSNYEIWLKKYGEEEANKRMFQCSEKMSKSMSGENNPFYGKKHSKITLDKIAKGHSEWIKSMPLEERERISSNISKAQIACKESDPEKYSEMKRRAGRISHLSQFKNLKQNKIEKIIAEKLTEYGLDFEYSVILGFNQFDFGSKEYRILLEVQGDYWHCNPFIYSCPKNDIQINQIEKDKRKKDFALSHNMSIFYIWEKDIKEGNFKTLNDIKDAINTIKATNE